MKLITLLFSLIILSTTSLAIFENYNFKNAEDKQRYHELTTKLRCMVCQNQSLADSNASLAGDLRQIVFEKINNGLSDQEIIDFLLQRYGDFVLYQPPINPNTIILWLAPFGFLLFGIGFVVILSKRKTKKL